MVNIDLCVKLEKHTALKCKLMRAYAVQEAGKHEQGKERKRVHFVISLSLGGNRPLPHQP